MSLNPQLFPQQIYNRRSFNSLLCRQQGWDQSGLSKINCSLEAGDKITIEIVTRKISHKTSHGHDLIRASRKTIQATAYSTYYRRQVPREMTSNTRTQECGCLLQVYNVQCTLHTIIPRYNQPHRSQYRITANTQITIYRITANIQIKISFNNKHTDQPL